MRIILKDKRYLPGVSRRILEFAGDKRIIAFYGSMGAGKTTIIKAICKVLGAFDLVSSPTFTLVNEYKTDSGESIYHIDLYRIKKVEEVFDFGIEEYLSSGSYCFIEWPEKAENILPSETVKVRITLDDNQERILDIS
jgi:tRNA threonylcarbamoyladenosine biosynthesis protein TsaE